MSFANHNILDIALSIIPPTIVQIRKNLGTTVNKYGQAEANYGEWVGVYGIVQPGSEQNEHTEGVDFSKKHVTIWLRGIALDGTHIQWAPDQIRFVGKIFNVIGVKDWFPYDNYRECECVEVLNLDESQRGRIGLIAQKAKRQARKTKAAKEQASEQQMLPIDPVIGDGAEIKRKTEPSIFCPDKTVEDPQRVVESPKKSPVVGKAIIRF